MGAVARPAVAVASAALLLAGCGPGTVDVAGAPPAAADRAPCRSLLEAAPQQVAGQERRTVSPADGWGVAWGDPAIVLRCGVGAPAGFDAVSTCTTVEGIDWYTPEEQLEAPGDQTLTTVHRRPAVELRLPGEHWPPAAALVDVAETVREHTKRSGRCR